MKKVEIINVLFLFHFARDFSLITEILVASKIFCLHTERMKKAVLKVQTDCESWM